MSALHDNANWVRLVNEDDRAFWSAVLQIIPVLMLAVFIELRYIVNALGSVRVTPRLRLARTSLQLILFLGITMVLTVATSALVMGLRILGGFEEFPAAKEVALGVIIALVICGIAVPAMGIMARMSFESHSVPIARENVVPD